MSGPLLLGEIVEKDDMICLQTGSACWYPLGGNSHIAEKFRESFNGAQRSDLGRRLYMSGDVLQMENMEQMKARQLRQGIGAGPTAKKHLAAIAAGAVTKTNVIGIRKAINHVERLRHGWSGNRSNVTPEEADAMEAALKAREPRVVGELFMSGLDVLESPRWSKRWNERERAIIEDLDVIKLVRFDRIGRSGEHGVPVYRALGRNGDSFLYRNIPWQAAYYSGEQSGPVVVEE